MVHETCISNIIRNLFFEFWGFLFNRICSWYQKNTSLKSGKNSHWVLWRHLRQPSWFDIHQKPLRIFERRMQRNTRQIHVIADTSWIEIKINHSLPFLKANWMTTLSTLYLRHIPKSIMRSFLDFKKYPQDSYYTGRDTALSGQPVGITKTSVWYFRASHTFFSKSFNSVFIYSVMYFWME
jgi:hypothetical protein